MTAPRASVSPVLSSALGLAVAAATLVHPFGPDQALFHYVAREWLRHGALPYRDSFDHKTPGIYAVHAFTVAIFGDREWGIRAVECAAMVPLAFAVASIATPRGERPSTWLRAFSFLAVAVLYFGYFDYWSSAQCELWAVLASVAAVWVALRARVGLRTAAFAVGVLAAIASVMKPPAMLLSFVAVGALVVRARRESRGSSAIVLAAAALGSAVVALGVVAVFAANGALSDAVDVVFRANRHYVEREHLSRSAGDVAVRVLRTHHDYDPLGIVLRVAPIVVLVRRRRAAVLREAYAVALALVVAATLAIVWQGRFYGYHWSLLLAGEAVAAAALARDLERALRERVSSFEGRTVLASVAFVALYAASGDPSSGWARSFARSAAYATGVLDRASYARAFVAEGQLYFRDDIEEVGAWLREHARPDDRLLVRGYHTGLYVVSGLSYGGRFFWDLPLVDPRKDYRRAEWLEQDRADFERIAPRFVVAIRDDSSAEIARPEWFEARGYREVHVRRHFVVMERR